MDTPKFVSKVLSLEASVTALRNAFFSGEDALRREMAVGMILMAEQGDTSKQSKAILYDIYLEANERRYKTANRRINAAADLLDYVGIGVVRGWTVNEVGATAIALVAQELDGLEIGTITDVLHFVGKTPTKVPELPEGEDKPATMFTRRASDAKDAVIIETEHIHVALPKKVKRAELVSFALKLLTLADTMYGATLQRGQVMAVA